MKKALGTLVILALVFACFLLLRECQSNGGGNSPLTDHQTAKGAFLWS